MKINHFHTVSVGIKRFTRLKFINKIEKCENDFGVFYFQELITNDGLFLIVYVETPFGYSFFKFDFANSKVSYCDGYTIEKFYEDEFFKNYLNNLIIRILKIYEEMINKEPKNNTDKVSYIFNSRKNVFKKSTASIPIYKKYAKALQT